MSIPTYTVRTRSTLAEELVNSSFNHHLSTFHPSPTTMAPYPHDYASLTGHSSRRPSRIDSGHYKLLWRRTPIVFPQMCFFGLCCSFTGCFWLGIALNAFSVCLLLSVALAEWLQVRVGNVPVSHSPFVFGGWANILSPERQTAEHLLGHSRCSRPLASVHSYRSQMDASRGPCFHQIAGGSLVVQKRSRPLASVHEYQ